MVLYVTCPTNDKDLKVVCIYIRPVHSFYEILIQGMHPSTYTTRQIIPDILLYYWYVPYLEGYVIGTEITWMLWTGSISDACHLVICTTYGSHILIYW